jgi:FecR protein
MKLNQLALALTLGVGQGLWLSAWAAGNIDQVRGEASVLNRDGQARGAAKGERVVEGETIVTGGDGEVLLTTDDSGVLAVRPRSRVQIEAYRVTGNENDSVVLKLLRGSLRSITGWITKTAPRNYRLTTPTATIGIRGTDHETSVVEEGAEPGTYNQVTSGETSFSTTAGSINIGPGQAGHAPLGDQPPKPLPAPPPGIFPPRASDARVGELKTDAEGQRDQRLKVRQEQVQRSGGVSPQGNPRVSAQCAPGSPATATLDALLRAYERGDVAFLQRRLNPSMIGYSALLNDVMNDNAAQRQTRIQVLDTQMQCGPDVAVIDFAWEKQFLTNPGLVPTVVRGRSSVLVTQLAGGLGGQWAISGMVGDPVFQPPRASATGAAGGITVSPTTASFANSLSGCVAPPTVTANVNVVVNPVKVQANVTVDPKSGAVNCAVTSRYAFTCTASAIGSTAAPAPGPEVIVANPVCTATGQGASPVAGTLSITSAPLAIVVQGPSGAETTVSTIRLLTGSGTAGGYQISSTANATCFDTFALPLATPVCTGAASTLPVTIEVTDPDVAAGSVQVQALASNGDAETLTLPKVAPGVFRITSVPITRGAAATAPGNGRFDLVGATPASVTLSLKYTDALPGIAGAAVVRAATLTLLP